MKWEKVKLGDLYTVHNGLSKGKKFFGTGFPFLSFSIVFNKWFIPEQLYDLVEVDEKERNIYSIKKGDVFITRTSETMEELGMSTVALKDYPNATYNGFTKRLRPITELLEPRFIGYYLRTPEFRGKFMAFSAMTTRASLTNDDLLSLEVPVPSLLVQQRIASILSTYDDLIENNQKQIKLLEEAAQRLYKEWFVDLHFPGHENVKIVDGVPEGWESCRLRDVAEINGRNIDENYPYDKINYIDIGSVRNGRILEKANYNLEEAPGRAKRIVQDGDVIWGMVRPNLRAYAMVLNPDKNDVFSTGFAVLTSKKVPFSFLYCNVTTEEFVGYLVNCTNGAAYPAVKPIHFEEYNVSIPPNNLLNKFHNITEPYFRKIYYLNKQISSLREARDRLLPKLMSGEIEV
ncbi:restriction endonuclease subunit S [Phascolarctobacterium succinatutens]|uniref:restriction endonuclease subunit S n=1 Tax=Phascolarctobacterium succinatutens TaxID=626940 RepID=UPI0027B87E4F|nr:restriction endonuclease subunit S [Phascolarctobacterium succinatutens]